MTSHIAIILASAIAVSGASFVPAYAAGEGGGDTPTCAAGKIYDKATKKCVAKQSSLIDDDDIYANGRALAHQGRYDEAITVLSLAKDKNDPRILNYLGFSHRKAGRVTVGLGYYGEALRIDPDYVLVREYLGEAHLMLGDVAAARLQLSEIGKRCGTGCAEYRDLAAQIDAAVAKG
jgi:tetratricopeptide (TPR) repeat protein